MQQQNLEFLLFSAAPFHALLEKLILEDFMSLATDTALAATEDITIDVNRDLAPDSASIAPALSATAPEDPPDQHQKDHSEQGAEISLHNTEGSADDQQDVLTVWAGETPSTHVVGMTPPDEREGIPSAEVGTHLEPEGELCFCRICHDTNEEELLSPCQCPSSVHASCLRRWGETCSGQRNKCEICLTTYPEELSQEILRSPRAAANDAFWERTEQFRSFRAELVRSIEQLGIDIDPAPVLPRRWERERERNAERERQRRQSETDEPEVGTWLKRCIGVGKLLCILVVLLTAVGLVSLLHTDREPTLYVCVQLIGVVLVWLMVSFNWEGFIEKLKSICNDSLQPFFELLLPCFSFEVAVLVYLSGIKAIIGLVSHEDGCSWEGGGKRSTSGGGSCQPRQTVALFWAIETVLAVMVLVWYFGCHTPRTSAPPQRERSPRHRSPRAASRAGVQQATTDDWANALHSSVGNIYGPRGPANQAVARQGEPMRFIFVHRDIVDPESPVFQGIVQGGQQQLEAQQAVQFQRAARRSRHR